MFILRSHLRRPNGIPSSIDMLDFLVSVGESFNSSRGKLNFLTYVGISFNSDMLREYSIVVGVGWSFNLDMCHEYSAAKNQQPFRMDERHR